MKDAVVQSLKAGSHLCVRLQVTDTDPGPAPSHRARGHIIPDELLDGLLAVDMATGGIAHRILQLTLAHRAQGGLGGAGDDNVGVVVVAGTGVIQGHRLVWVSRGLQAK